MTRILSLNLLIRIDMHIQIGIVNGYMCVPSACLICVVSIPRHCRCFRNTTLASPNRRVLGLMSPKDFMLLIVQEWAQTENTLTIHLISSYAQMGRFPFPRENIYVPLSFRPIKDNMRQSVPPLSIKKKKNNERKIQVGNVEFTTDKPQCHTY